MSVQPDRLAVDPELLADAGRRLRALTEALAQVAPHYRGPQQPPPLGDPTCAAAYATAHQQLAGLVTAAAAQAASLAATVSAAAVLYTVLDSGRGR
jgi:hypothetical protein